MDNTCVPVVLHRTGDCSRLICTGRAGVCVWTGVYPAVWCYGAVQLRAVPAPLGLQLGLAAGFVNHPTPGLMVHTRLSPSAARLHEHGSKGLGATVQQGLCRKCATMGQGAKGAGNHL